MMATKQTKSSNEPSWWGGEQTWLPGLVMILIGGVFLLRNYTNFDLENWWALFIFIPAATNLGDAYRAYQSGGFGQAARSHLFWGAFFALIATAFLLGLDFGLLWPAFLILGGIGMLLGAFHDGSK
jgi:hypothetical protein